MVGASHVDESERGSVALLAEERACEDTDGYC
jgi:hypothetical protein